MRNRRIAKPKVVIAVSYNSSKSGAATDSVRRLIDQSGATKMDIDYYDLVPPAEDLEEIYSDNEKRHQVFAQAKLKAKKYLENVDCLILPGNGAKVDPRLYGDNLPDSEKSDIDLGRAIAEMALAHVAIQKGMPILAICGGHQILNVYLGGKTIDLDYDESAKYLDYSINEFKAESELAKIAFSSLNKLEAPFFGAHGQAVDPDHIGGKGWVAGDDLLAIVANAKNQSGNIEAMEAKYGAPIYSVQFHPEVAVAGMYSVVYQAIAYQAKTKEQIMINYNIIKATKDAAESYAIKKKMHSELQSGLHYKDSDSALKGTKAETHKLKTGHTPHSLFTETKTSNDAIYHDSKQIKKTRK